MVEWAICHFEGKQDYTFQSYTVIFTVREEMSNMPSSWCVEIKRKNNYYIYKKNIFIFNLLSCEPVISDYVNLKKIYCKTVLTFHILKYSNFDLHEQDVH